MSLNPILSVYLAALLQSAGGRYYNECLKEFPAAARTGATLLLTNPNLHFQATLLDTYRAETFAMDMHTREYSSKGDWRWITGILFSYQNSTFLKLECNRKLIDLPYHCKKLSANWLISSLRPELNRALAQIRFKANT